VTYQEELATDQAKLVELLTNMDVPSMRREFGHWNLLWLQRNLFIRNGRHRDFAEADRLVKKLLHEFFE
jgi:hypothetical protein